MVSVDVKHHVYLHTYSKNKIFPEVSVEIFFQKLKIPCELDLNFHSLTLVQILPPAQIGNGTNGS